MKKKFLLILIIIIVIAIFAIGYFIIKNKRAEETINNNFILKIGGDDYATTIGSYLNKYYYISEDKSTVVIKIDGFSETTGKSTDKTTIKKLNKTTVEKYIRNLEENINKNAFEPEYIETQFGKLPDIKSPAYVITYKGDNIRVEFDKEFYKQTEEFLNNILK